GSVPTDLQASAANSQPKKSHHPPPVLELVLSLLGLRHLVIAELQRLLRQSLARSPSSRDTFVSPISSRQALSFCNSSERLGWRKFEPGAPMKKMNFAAAAVTGLAFAALPVSTTEAAPLAGAF